MEIVYDVHGVVDKNANDGKKSIKHLYIVTVPLPRHTFRKNKFPFDKSP